jgi:cytochrome P450
MDLNRSATQVAAPDDLESRIRSFSLYAPWVQGDPVSVFGELRQAGPVLRSEQHGGFWLLTRHQDIEWAARNPEIFSSARPTIPSVSILGDEGQIPLSLDGDVHRRWRQALADTFSPGTINHFTPQIRAVAAELVDGIATRSGCEFIADFAVALPAEAFLIDFGIGRDRLRDMLGFKEWLIREAIPSAHSPAEMAAAVRPLRDFFAEAVEERRRDTSPEARDVISHLLRARYDGRSPTMDEMTNSLLISMLASLDTTTSALGLIWAWLADNPEQRAWMLAHPESRTQFTEELIRTQPVNTTARVLTQDVELHGVVMREGDGVILPWGMSGLDPDVFEDPRRVDPQRPARRQLAFGAGPHRCIGMHLARRIVSIALEEWHQRIPDYRLAPGDPPVGHYSYVRGLDRLPLLLG